MQLWDFPRRLDVHLRAGWRRWVLGCTASTLMVAITVALLRPFRSDLGLLNVALLLLLLSVVGAASGGWVIGLYTSVLSNLAFNFFFVPPLYRLGVQSPDNALALGVFLLVTAITAALLAQRRDSATEARLRAAEAQRLLALSEQNALEAERRARETETLLELSRTIANQPLEGIPAAISEAIVRDFPVSACTLYRLEGGELVPLAHAGEGDRVLSRSETSVALQAVAAGGPIGVSAPAPTDASGSRVGAPRRQVRSDQFLLSLKVENVAVGVLRIRTAGTPLTGDQGRLLEAFCANAAASLRRASLTAAAQSAAVLAESNRLKSALLASVSHDLRTPLTAIKASVANLMASDVEWSEAARQEFLGAIDGETDRLSRLVGDLLDVSRIEAGALRLDLDWNDLGELLSRAVYRFEQMAPERAVNLVVAEPLPVLRFDYVQVDRVVANLLDNADKYSPPGTPVELRARVENDRVSVSVRDQGSGVPREDRRRVFEPFYRSQQRSTSAGGTGLGLAISRGIVTAHGGHIRVDGDHGAVFTFTLPRDTAGERVTFTKPSPAAEPTR
ncbi:MAG TPA: ATP-binding protein [Dehalococcoidia bacterium]